MKKPKKELSRTEIELRQWCIDQAMRWPWHHQQATTYPHHVTPPDVIDGAEKIHKWITRS